MSHFTYKSVEESKIDNCLKQGDILERTPDLDEVINEIHPYFALNDYKFFLVLTQSCDLTQKITSNKLKYINLAVVRTLSSILEKETEGLYKDELAKKINLLSFNNRNKLDDFLRKLLNNNFTEYFYLHKDVDNNISDDYVANLRVSFALKAQEHYGTVLNAKVLELKDEFKAKLGWLIGNLYSRVATQDWTPLNKSDAEFKEMIQEILNNRFIFKEDPKDFLGELEKLKAKSELIEMDNDDLLTLVNELKTPDTKSKIKERVINLLKASKLVQDDNIDKVTNIIASDSTLLNLMKRF